MAAKTQSTIIVMAIVILMSIAFHYVHSEIVESQVNTILKEKVDGIEEDVQRRVMSRVTKRMGDITSTSLSGRLLIQQSVQENRLGIQKLKNRLEQHKCNENDTDIPITGVSPELRNLGQPVP